MVASTTPFLVVGEALMDIVRRPGTAPVEHVGGSPANVAIGLARLGHKVLLATALGADARGDIVRSHLEGNGVTVDNGLDNGQPTSTAIATLDERGAATYEFDLHWEPGTVAIAEGTGHLHTGSIAAVIQPGAGDVVEAIERGRATATVSYDPNVRPSIMGDLDAARAQIERVIRSADVVKASSDDLDLLYPGQAVEDVLAQWGDLGPALTVATLGAEGVTYRVTGTGEYVSVPAPDSPVVDTVGAGDSFMAGLISGLAVAGFLGGPTERAALQAADAAAVAAAIERGNRCGTITVSRAGAYAPSLDEL